jgi:dienelactone hydrolase
MVVWGGLRPIAAQVVVDVLGLLGFGYATLTTITTTTTTHDDEKQRTPAITNNTKNAVVLVTTAVSTVLMSGNWTNRWTVIFPMIPLVVLQGLRRWNISNHHAWIRGTIAIGSVLLILLAGVCSVLFPAVELPPTPNSLYNVGVVDVFLPVHFQHSTTLEDAQDVCPKTQDHVTARIFYPTLEKNEGGGGIPYLKPETSIAFCEETMKYGAPPPLQTYDWMLHQWRLTQIDAKKHAQPLGGTTTSTLTTKTTKLPLIFHSHGLGGNSEMYSYQTRSLAAKGYVVVVLDHSDGSAPVVARKDGTVLLRNERIWNDWRAGGEEGAYKRSRRAMTEYRAQELLAAVESVVGLNAENIPELHNVGLSFVDRLNTEEVHYMGHSFGGAAAFHAARQRPPTSVIAHEPALDWMPDATRGSLFALEKLNESATNYTYWTVVQPPDNSNHTTTTTTVTDEDPLTMVSSVHDTEMLVLFSHEWESKQLGGVHVLKDIYQRGLLGPKGGVSQVAVIAGAHHNEFSDTSMLTPTWLGRATGLTGKRSPLETAHEIHTRTMDFLQAVRERQTQ